MQLDVDLSLVPPKRATYLDKKLDESRSNEDRTARTTLGSHTNIAATRFVGELVFLYPRFEKQAYAKFDMPLFIQIIMKV